MYDSPRHPLIAGVLLAALISLAGSAAIAEEAHAGGGEASLVLPDLGRRDLPRYDAGQHAAVRWASWSVCSASSSAW